MLDWYRLLNINYQTGSWYGGFVAGTRIKIFVKSPSLHPILGPPFAPKPLFQPQFSDICKVRKIIQNPFFFFFFQFCDVDKVLIIHKNI